MNDFAAGLRKWFGGLWYRLTGKPAPAQEAGAPDSKKGLRAIEDPVTIPEAWKLDTEDPEGEPTEKKEMSKEEKKAKKKASGKKAAEEAAAIRTVKAEEEIKTARAEEENGAAEAEMQEILDATAEMDEIDAKNDKKDDTECFENRELSWLKFNERVLEEAEDLDNPLCERMSFLSIYQSNLDEFFMVRVGSLYDQMLLNDNAKENKTFMSPSEQIGAICKRVKKLAERNGQAYRDLMKSVREYGIRLTDFASLEDNEAAYLETYFRNEVLPLLSPVVVGKRTTLPFMENKDLYAFCILKKKGDKDRLGIVPCSVKSLNRLIRIPAHRGEYMLAEELVLHFLPLVFKQYTVDEKAVIRITRNADIDAEAVSDEDFDYREMMAQMIRSRKRLSPIRLEYSRPLSKKTVERLAALLNLDTKQTFLTETPLNLSFFSAFKNDLYGQNALFYEKRQPQRSASVDESRPMIEQIEEKDMLLYYPYERMNAMIRLLEEAAKDPSVESIRMTLYRVAKQSQIVAALIAASEAGKKVDVLVELKARFDEENNIYWSHMLEDAGCNVLYGLGKYKVHSKLLLITKKKGEERSYITQIGTGNYNESTARLYTDLCFMTAKKEIGLDAVRVFDALCEEQIPEGFEKLLVAPRCLQNRILEMIEREIEHAEAGEEAYIGLKLNSVTDKDIIDALIRASEAGVRIEMVVRGINCLRSGIPGRTDNIRIVSIVGRFLEHARIYIFGTPDREKIYISSADFMTRNTLRRVEVASPIEDANLREKIHHIFSMQLADNVKVREQKKSGNYRKVRTEAGTEKLNSQEKLYQEAYDGTL